MRDSLKERCELLTENYSVIDRNFKWEYEVMHIVAANTFTSVGLKADPEKMKECKDMLAKKHGFFTSLRSTTQLALISKMAIESDPAAYLEEVTAVYEKIIEGKVFSSNYMVLPAMVICDQHKADEADAIIQKMKTIMEKMEKEHPLLTGSEDLAFAALMAMTAENVDKMIEDMEGCFEILKKKFPMHKNAVQGLCQVLALSGNGTEEKCAKAVAIFDSLKEMGVKYGKTGELAALGALVDVDMEAEEIAREIMECSELLKKERDFGNLLLGEEYRSMFAALLVVEEYALGKNGLYVTTLGSSIAIEISDLLLTAFILLL